jgi:hypothetical protein
MTTAFDPGYGAQPFRSLCEEYPVASVYSAQDFRVEWGPVFHRGRLDGSARVLVIGQDPAQHEIVVRRCLVGEGGHRVQGFLKKVGIDASYVLINTFLYSVYGQGGGERHKNDPGIIAYRNRWLDALLPGNKRVEAVVAFGRLADGAWKAWKATPKGSAVDVTYCNVTHPTQPEGSSKGNPEKLKAAMKAMLQNWNAALPTLREAIKHPDASRPLVTYGETLQDGDLADIPAADLPAGSPPWMRGAANWAKRVGPTPADKRVNILVTVPRAFRPPEA